MNTNTVKTRQNRISFNFSAKVVIQATSLNADWTRSQVLSLLKAFVAMGSQLEIITHNPFLYFYPYMSQLDRSAAPPLREIESITIPPVSQLSLSNGTPVYIINAGSQDVMKMEMIFDAGRWQESQRAVAATTSKLLPEGTISKSAQQVAEEIDFYGATIQTEATIDYGLVTLYSLNKHLDHLFPLLQEVIYEPTFPEKELKTYIQNSKQRLMVNLQKVDFLAHREFNESLYGKEYPIGYTTAPEDYDTIDSTHLKHFHAAQYKSGNCKIILAGKIADATLELLEKYFGKNKIDKGGNGQYRIQPIKSFTERKVFALKKDAVQSGIRIGKMLVNKLHPDYPTLRILNTILGGYFGSRLMQNLREEKGYCYGVHSSIASYLHSAHMAITTEVGGEVTRDAVREIYHEVDRLRSDLVPEEELHLVRNYMLGVFLGDVDGPFNVAEVMRGLIVYGLDETFFYQLVDRIKTVTPAELQQMAIKYLDPESMLEVVAGNPELVARPETTVLSDIGSDEQLS
jgi:predicted Zn-dependent peptidase